MNKMIKHPKQPKSLVAFVLGFTLSVAGILTGLAANVDAQESQALHFLDLNITQVGNGGDLLFIPGLNSSADTFNEVCDAFTQTHRCHLLQLPGFAGAPPLQNVEDGFLPTINEQILAYIKQEKLNKPIIVGHSLGGFVALQIAISNPEDVGALVIVDSLPFLPGVQFPGATVERMQSIATNMKKMMLVPSDEQYIQRLPQQLMGMTRDNEHLQTLVEWSKTSDRLTMAQAMYELQTTDLRQDIASIKVPTIVFGAWAAYENFGTTKAMTEQTFATQYQALKNKNIHVSDSSYHFIMWDDKEWLLDLMGDFLAANK